MKSKLSTVLTALPLAALTLALTVSAQATLVYLADNTGQTEFSTSSSTNTDWQAQAFTTTATAYTLTDVALPLCNSTARTGTFALSIYDSTGTGGAPGGWVTDVRDSIDAATIGLATALYDVPGLSIVLNPSTSYFLVLKGTALVGESLGIEWSYTDALEGVGFPSAYFASSDSGGTWGAPSDVYSNMMRIQASFTAVPEPSGTLALGGLLVSALFLRTRRGIRA